MKYTVKMIEDLSNQRTPVASNTRKRTKKGALSVSDIEALRDDEQDMIELERQRNEERLRRIEEERKRREAEIEALREREEQNQRQFDIRAAKEERDADRLVTNQLKRDFSAPDDSAKKASTYQKYKEVMTQDLNDDYDPYLNAVKANGSRQGFARDVDTANFIKNLANRLSATGNTATMEDGLKTANQELSRLTDDERKLLMDYVRAGKDATRDLNSMIGGASVKRDYNPLATINENKAKFLRSTGMSEDDFKRYQEYAQFVSDYEDRTKTQEEIKNKTNTGNKVKDLANAAGYTALDVALSPAEGVQAFAGSFRQPKDSRMPVNTNNELYRLHNVSRDIENQVNQNIDEFYGTNDKAAKLAKFAYNTGVSIGKAGMAMAIGGTVGEAAGGLGASEGVARTAANLATLPQFGATSFASTFQDAQDRGLTKGQAYSLATVSGLAEMGTEVFSLDHFWDIAKKSGSQAAKSALADWIVQAGIEGTEELASDVINEITDRAITGNKSEYETNVRELMKAGLSEDEARKTATIEMLKEWGQDFAGGVISGSVFGGVHFTSNAVQAKKLFADGNYKEFAESIDTDKNSYASEEDYKIALSAKEKAEALVEKQEAGKKITVDDKVTLNNLLGETMAAAQNKTEESENAESQQSENVVSETTQGQQSQKITLEDIPTLYDGQTTHEATVNGNAEEITAKEAYLYGAQGLDLQSDSQAIQTAYEAGQGRLEDIRAEEEIKRDVPESIITENTSIPETTIEDVPEQFKSGQTYAAEENGEEIEISAADAYIMGANGDTLDTEIPELKLAYNEGVQKRTKIASEQKIAPVQLKEAKAKDLSGNIFTVKGITEDKNTIMLETSNGEIPASEVTFQNNAVQTLYNNAVAQATPRLSNAYIEYYNPGTPVATYNIAFNRFKNAGALGAKSFEATLKKNRYLADLMGEENAKEVYSLGAEERETEKKEEKKARKAKGRITDNRKTKEDNDPLYNIAKQMAYVTGQDIEITDDLDSQINGEFQKSAAKIILNANNDNMWQTFFHEAVGEFSEAWNENGMKEVQDEILNWFIDEYGQKAIEDKIAAYQKAYREVEGEKAYREAANEFINDSLSGLFSTPEGMQDFADWLYKNETQTKAESILERITNFIKDLIDSVKEYLNTHKSMSDASRATMLMEADRAAGLRARLFDVMEEARKNYEANATEEEAQTESKKKHSLNTFGFEKYSNKEIERIARGTNPSIIIAENKNDIINYINDYVGTNSKKKLYLGTIGNELANKIKKDTGEDLKGYNISITNAFENSHSNPATEEPRGQIAITPEFIADNLSTTINDYDSVKLSTGKRGDKALVFKKNNGARITAVENISNGKHSLYLQTMHAIKKAAPSEEIQNKSANLTTSETYTDKASSDLSITPKTKKSTTNFSLKTPVEESGDLIAVHNITQEQLMKTIDLGGFPMPSIAITKAAMGHDMYGDISVVFNKDAIDPKKNKGNRVYSGDAYTPEFPRIGYKINSKKVWDIDERVRGILGDLYNQLESAGIDPDNAEDRLTRWNGNAKDAYGDKDALRYAFLKENGEDVKLKYRDKAISSTYDNDELRYMNGQFINPEYLNTLASDYEYGKNHPEELKDIRDRLNKYIADNSKEEIERVKNSEKSDRVKQNLLNFYQNRYNDENFKSYDLYELAKAIKRYRDTGIKQELDKYETRHAINAAMEGKDEAYEKWLNDLFDGVVEKIGIRNNKEVFLPSGNRRKWDALYDDFNLDNIVKAMKNEPETGQGWAGHYSFLGSVNRAYASLDDIRSDKGRLKMMDEAKYEEAKKEIENELLNIAKRLKPNPEYDAWSITSDIAEAVAKRKTRNGIKTYLSEWYKVSESDMNDIMELVDRARTLPTGYFEAKPRRAVGFNEIAEVVLPDTTDQELIKGLEDNNIPYATYKEGDKADRKAKLNAIDDAKFSVKVDNRGRELTKDQQKYFKDSKLRDEEDRLKVMYHGAEEANYTIFDPQFSDDATSLFFTDNHYVAAGYAGTEDYVDLNNIRKKGSIKTLKDLEKRFEDTDYRVREENGEYIIEDIEDPEDPVVFIRGNSIEEVYNDFVQDFVWNGENGEYGGVYRVYLNATNPLVIDANGSNWNHITWEPEDKSPVYGPLTTTRGIAAYGKAHGYDSVIINNVKDNGYYASDNEPSQIAIVFNSNQIKSIDNEHPSEDEDIRYSLNMLDTEYDTALKNNNMEVANALVRQAANEAGYNSPALYHGTLDFGFTQIDLDKMDDKISFFATDTLSMASSYSGTQKERSISEDAKISEENIVDSLKELHRWKDIRQFKAGDENARYDYLNERFKRMNDFAKQHERDLRERGLLDEYRDLANTLVEQIMFKNFDDRAINRKLRPLREAHYVISDYARDIREAMLPLRREGMGRNVYMLDGIPKTEENVRDYLPDEYQGIYKLYGNLDNMLSIDGNGSNWNSIKVNGEELATREIAKKAKDLGYDGVIIRNITDDGGRNNALNHYVERGNVYIFFDPRTQVKSGDAVTYDGNGNVIPLSERFNPENNDIRYSLSGIDDTLFDYRKYSLSDWELWSSSFDVTDEDLKNTFIGDETVSDDPDYTTRKAEQVISNILTKVNENFKGQKVSSETIERIARNVKKKAGSGATIDDLKNNLTKIFDWMQNSREVDYREAVEYIAQSVAPVIENTKTTNPQEQKDYDDLKKAIRARKIKLTPEQKKEVSAVYGSWKDFFGQAGGLLTIDDKNGVSTDSIWSDLVEVAARSGQILDLEAPDVSQPIELLELMKNAAPQLVTDYGGNLEEASMNLAMDILADYYEAEAEAIRQNTRESMLSDTEAGKEAIKAVNKAKAQLNNEAKAYKEKVREAYQKKYEAQKKMLEALKRDNEELQRSNSVWYGKYKELSEKQIDAQAVKTASRKSVKDYIDTQEARKQRDNIAKIGWQMVERLTRPTDKKHIPDALKMPITDFLSSIDFIPERARLDSKNTLRWQDAMRNLSDMLAHADQEHADLEGADIQSIMDPELSYQMSKFAKEHEGEKVTSLDGQALKQLSKIMKSLQALMNKSNEFFANEQFKHIDDAGKATIDTLYERENLPSMGEVKEKVYNLTSVDMLEPISYFKEMGDAPLSIYKEFRTGMDTRIKRITDTGEYFKEITKGIDVSTWTGDKADVHEFKISNFGTQEEPTIFRLTTAQIMSLYESMKRDQAKHHAIIGGITAEDITTKKGLKKNTIRKSRPVHITPMEYHKIISVLTPEQIKLADEMQKYMANDCAKWGNEVTMKLYGYKKFTDKNYFPIKVDDNTIQTTDRTENKNTSINAIRNMSASKDLTPKANNALVIRDIFDVFSDHVTDMATYEGYCLPVADALRWFNYQEKDIHTGYRPDNENSIQTRNSVKEEIDRVYGSHMKQYFVNLIRDINGEKAKTYSTNLEWLVGNYKAAAVGANVRVAIQQPTAYTRAAYMMDTKYLTRALADSIHAPKYSKEAIEKSMIARWKSEGYYETSLGHTTKQMITGIERPMDKIQDATGILAQLGDDLTWGMIYHAVQLETKDKTNFSPGTKAFDDAVVERFNNIIDETQVVDSVLHKSQIMRDQNALVKMATAFMAEPTKSYNMMHRSFMGDKLGTSKNALKKAVAVFVTNSLFTAAAASIVDAFRKDDDETPWIERYLEALIGYDVLTDDDKSLKDKIKAAVFSNVGSGLNPLNLMPYAKDIMSTLEGYDTARMDTAGLASFYTALTQTAKYATGESNKTLYGVIKSDARAAAQLTGIPFYNALREFETVYNAISKENLIVSTGRTSAYAPVYKAIEKDGDIQAEVNNVIEDKKKEKIADDMTPEQKAETEKKIRSAVKNSLTTKYKAQMVELYGKDKTAAAELKTKLIQAYMAAGDTREDANNKINKWIES